MWTKTSLAGACLILLALPTGAAEPYRFKIDGKEVPFVIDKLSGPEPQAGDVVRLGYPAAIFTLDAPGEYDLIKKQGRLYRKVGETTQLIYAEVEGDYKGGVREDGLRNLKPEEWAGIRGLKLDGWSPQVGEELAKLPPSQALWEITCGFRKPGSKSLPPLPQGLRYLVVEEHQSPGFEDTTSLNAFDSLQYFRGDWMSSHGFPGGPPIKGHGLPSKRLAGHHQLRFLASNELDEGDDLGSLTELQVLETPGTHLNSLDFSNRLPHLRQIEASRCAIRSLKNLEGAPALTSLRVALNPVKELPNAPLPHLEKLDVLGTLVEAGEANSFRQRNPGCRLDWDYKESLSQALASADKLRVRSGGTCHRGMQEEKTLLEKPGRQAVLDLLSKVQLRDEPRGIECMCCGNPTLEFYAGDKLVAMVGYHHGQLLRYSQGWPADVVLTADSAVAISDWLAGQGVPGPKAELDHGKLAQRQAQGEQERATRGFSEELRTIYRKTGQPGQVVYVQDPSPNTKESSPLSKALQPPDKHIHELLQVVGSSLHGWTQYTEASLTCYQLLMQVPADKLEPVLEEAILGEDRTLRRGAARVWLMHLPKWQPKNPACYTRTLEIIGQAREPEVRFQAVAALENWKGQVQSQSVMKSMLADPDVNIRMAALVKVGKWGLSVLYPVLLDALNGKPPVIQALAAVPADEEFEASQNEGGKEWDAAALGAGIAQLHEAIPAIQKGNQGPIRRLALALLGRTEELDKTCFQEGLLPFAVTAVARDKGKHGLNLALACKLSSDQVKELCTALKVKDLEELRKRAKP